MCHLGMLEQVARDGWCLFDLQALEFQCSLGQQVLAQTKLFPAP